MSNLYQTLLTRIVEKNAGNPKNIDEVRQEIRFIADQLRREQNIESDIDAAFCYYIAGYYVQGMYLARRIDLNRIPLIQKWLLLFIRKDLQKLENSLTKLMSEKEYNDQSIKERIENKGLSDIDAVNLIVNLKVAEIIAGLLNFIKTGDENYISELFKTLELCQRLVCKAGVWSTWWRLECLRVIIVEFFESSLWFQLKALVTSKESHETVDKYITAKYSKGKALEFWRTQIEALPRITDPSRCSFCISVPTSGGKTMVAEIAVLQFLIDFRDQPEAKCVYIAPYRKLALEVEDTISNAFSLVDTEHTSTFYGGREIDIFDARGLEKAKILIVTPEKLDSMLRQYPTLLSQIKLVIADEGHMIGDQGLRGYRYRFLLERLIYRIRIRKTSNAEKARIILISGVLPNVKDFADLIAGSSTNIVKIDWRPLDEPIIGNWVWTGKDLLTDDTNLAKPIPFDTVCKSPDEFEEIVVKVAVSYAHTHPTMVFSASKRAISSPSLLNLLECIASNHKLFASKPLAQSLARSIHFRQYYSLLESGIAIHHAALPRNLRKEMEKRIDNGQVRLLFASPTLAHGVNIPFHSVLVYRLHHYHGTPIAHATFWNVVGRVGRPIKNKPTWNNLESPLVLFFLNKSWKSNEEDQIDARLSTELKNARGQYQVASPFLKFLQQIRDAAKEVHSHSISDLVSSLSEKETVRDVLGETAYKKLKPIGNTSIDDFLKILDEHICAMLAENGIDENNASEWLQQSVYELIELFVKASEIDADYLDDIRSMVLARIKFNLQYLSSARRYQSYLLGLPTNDCEEIRKHEEVLFTWYQECSGIFTRNFDSGLSGFINILNFSSTLSICRKWQIKRKMKNNLQLSFDFDILDKKTVAQGKLFQEWLNGEELKSLEKSLHQLLPKVEFDSYREGMFEKNLPWSVSAICRYLNSVAKNKSIQLTKDLDYLTAFVKYGVNSKIACHLVQMGISRVDAVKIGSLFEKKSLVIEFDDEELPSFDGDFSETLKLLNVLTKHHLKDLKIGKDTVRKITGIRAHSSKQIVDIEPEFPPFEFDPTYDEE